MTAVTLHASLELPALPPEPATGRSGTCIWLGALASPILWLPGPLISTYLTVPLVLQLGVPTEAAALGQGRGGFLRFRSGNTLRILPLSSHFSLGKEMKVAFSLQKCNPLLRS